MRSPSTAMKSSPHLPQIEKACVQQRRLNAAKNNNKINFKKLKKKTLYGIYLSAYLARICVILVGF